MKKLPQAELSPTDPRTECMISKSYTEYTTQNMKKAHVHQHYEILHTFPTGRDVWTKNNIYRLYPNYVAFFPPGQPHFTKTMKVGGKCENYVISFTEKFINQFTSAFHIDIEDMFSHTTRSYSAEQIIKIEGLMADLLAEGKKTNMYNTSENPMFIALFMNLIVTLSQGEKADNYVNDPETIDFILTYVKNNFTSPTLTLDFLSKLFASSKSNICHKIKDKTGTSLSNIVNNYRIKYACELLKRTNSPITKISGECGYTSITYFFEQFKLRCGCTPVEYRKQK